jgi:quinol monooxygenase YgiN
VSVVVVATAIPGPGRANVVRAAFLRAVPLVHGEEGCTLYALHEGADRFVLIEKWESEAALAAHAAAPALAQLRADLDGATTADIDIQVLTAVPGGTDSLGVL